MKLLQVDKHRNGVWGIDFYVAIIQGEETDDEEINNKKFLVTEYPEEENNTGGLLTSVICLDLLQGEAATIKFGVNSWRPETFHDFMLDVAIPEFEKQRELELQKFIESRNAKTQEVSNE